MSKQLLPKVGLLKTPLFLLAFLALFYQSGSAQVASYYRFSQSSGTYTPIVGTDLLGSSFDDNTSTVVTIPSFNYNGTLVNRMFVCSNGWLGFRASGNITTTTSTPLSSGATATGFIAPMGVDLIYASAGTPSVSWAVVGTEVVVQWQDVGRYQSGGNTERLSFQVRMDTVSGIISYVYSGLTGAAQTSNFPQIGLRGTDNTFATNVNNRELTTVSAWTATLPGTSNSSTVALVDSSSTIALPTSGLIFRFSPATCFPPTGVSVTAITSTSATLNWIAPTQGTPLAYGWEIVAHNAGSGATPVASNYLFPAATTDNTGSVLSPSTTYDVYVKTGCSLTDSSVWSSVYSFTTACGSATALPWTEGFESLSPTGAGLFPSCWTTANLYGTNIPGSDSSNVIVGTTYGGAHGGAKYLFSQYNNTAWVYTPGFQLTAGTSYDFSFFMENKDFTAAGDFVMDVAYGSSADAASMTNALVTANQTTNTTYQQFKSTFTPATTGIYYFGIKTTSPNTNPWYLSFDDFSLLQTPQCNPPTAVAASNVTPTSADLSWTAPVVGTPAGYGWEVVASGAGPYATPVVSNFVIAPTTTASTGSVLTPNTTYDVYLKTGCSLTNLSDTSTFSQVYTFTTPCNAITSIPYLESFDAGGLPACWTAAEDVNGSSVHWDQTTADGTNGVSGPQAGAGFTFLDVYNAYDTYNSYNLSSPPFTLPAAVQQVSYYYYLGADGYQGTGGDPSPLILQISTDGGATWTDLYTHDATNSTFAADNAVSNWYLNTVLLPTYTSQTVQFRFAANSNYGSGSTNIGIDEFAITTAPNCLPPTGVTASNITATSADISWTAPAAGSPAGYGWEVVASGAGPYATPVVSNYVIAPVTTANTGSVLTPNTTYDVYVKTGCSLTNLSDTSTFSIVYTFTTPCAIVTALPYLQSFDAAGIPACWTASEGSGGSSIHWDQTAADATHGASAAQAGAGFAFLNVYNGQTAYNPYNLTSVPFALPSAVQQVSYYYFLGSTGYTGTDPTGTDPYPLTLQISTDAGATWTDIYNHSTANSTFATTNATSNWHLNTVFLTAYTNQTAIFRFVSISNYGSGMTNQGVDEFSISPAPTCLAPTALATSGVTATGGTLTWTASTSAPANGYYYVVVASGAGSGGTAVASGATAAGVTTATVSGLTPSTAYDVFVRAVCSSVDSSAWAGPVALTTIAACAAPTALGTHNTTTTGTTISWTASASAPSAGYAWEVVASGAGSAGTPVASGTSPLGTDSAVVSGLSSATAYDVYVQSNCGSATSTWAGPISVTTACGTYALPLIQGFNSTTRPVCWTQQYVSGTSDLLYVPSSNYPTTTPQEGTDYVNWASYTSAVPAGAETRLVSPVIVTTGTPSVDVSFYWLNDITNYTTGAYLNEGVTVQYSTNGTTWTDVQFFPRADSSVTTSSAWIQKLLTLPAGAGNQPTLYVGFKFHSEYGNNCSFDNLHIYATPSCAGQPSALASSNITPTTATASWTAATPVPASGYHWVVVASGGSPTGTLVTSGTATTAADSAAITGLTPNTAYDFYVQSDCGGASLGAFAGPLSITTPPTCVAASALTVGTITSTGGSITWTASPSAPANGYVYVVVASGAGANGTPITSGSVAAGVTTATFSGLTANTPYDVYVRAACSGSDSSAWAGPLSINTPCGSIGLPLIQGFNSTSIPACWSQQYVSGTIDMQYLSSSSNPNTTPQEGADYVFWSSYSYPNTAGNETRLVSPPIVTTGTPSVDVSFYWFNDASNYTTGNYLNEGVTLQYSTNGTTWTDVQFYPRVDLAVTTGSGWFQKVITLPAAVGNQSTVYVGFKFHSEYGNNCSFDNLHVYSTPSCAGAPSALASSNVTPYTATATWTDATPVPANGYNWVVVASGAGPAGTAVASGSSITDTALITGLTPATSYDFFVQSDCGGGSTGLWAGPLNITTPPTCVAPSAVTLTSSTNASIDISWTASPSAPANGYIYEVVDSGAGPNATVVTSGTVAAGITTVSISGLNTNTYYNVYVRADCSGGDSSAWSSPLSILTPCTNIGLPLIQGFNGNIIPSCWTQQYVIGTGDLQYLTNSINPVITPQEGTNFVYWNSYSIGNGDETRLISPPITSTGTSSVDISFYWYNENNPNYNSGQYLSEGVEVQYSLDGVTWTDVQFYARQDVTLASGVGRWNKKFLTLPAAVGNQSTVYVGFKFHSGFGDNCGFDNLNIFPSAPCAGGPTNITASPTSTTTATLNWTAAASAPANGYNWVIVAAGDSVNGTVIASGATAAGVTTASATGLTANTAYDVYIQNNCGGALGTGYWVGPLGFSTPCNAITTIPWTEGFENITNPGTDVLPSCWLGTPAGRWNSDNAPLGFPTNIQARGGTHYIWNRYNAQDTIYTPSFTLTGGTQYEFYFYYQTDGSNGWDSIVAMYGNGQTPSGMLYGIGTPVTGPTNLNYVKYSAIFTPATSGDYTFGVQLVAQFAPNNIAFDDFGLQVVVPCPNPPLAGVITGPSSVCAGTAVNLSLTGYSPYTVLQWQASIDSVNFVDIPLANSDYYTDYPTNVTYYRVKVNCADSTYTSIFTVNMNAPTLCYCTAGLGGGCGGNDIDTAAIQGTNFFVNYTTCNTTTNGDAYTAFPQLGDSTTTLQRGSAYTLQLHFTGTSISSAWIDYNQDGQFDASEWVQITTAATGGTATLNVPANAVLGTTGFRIRSRAQGNNNGANDACSGFGSGETFDFLITIADTICTNHTPTVTPTVTDASCFGSTNGAITVAVSGGLAPFAHHWSTGDSTVTVANLASGSYRDTVYYGPGCTYLAGPFVVGQPTALVAVTDSISPVSCFGGTNGAVYVSVSGGTPTYSHLWNSGATTASLSGVAAGSYTDTITDSHGCTVILGPDTVGQPASALAVVVDSTHSVKCNGGSNGAAYITASGGTGPYTYLWSDPAQSTTDDVTGLALGRYTVVVTDANLCTASISDSVSQPAVLAIITDSVVNTKCHTSSDGSIYAHVTGGTIPYTYLWTGGSTAVNLFFKPAGTYTLSVTDRNGCSVTATDTITSPGALAVTSNINNQIPNGAFGAITATASGGTAPYSYRWNTGDSTATISNLVANVYIVTVTDKNGCTVSQRDTVKIVGIQETAGDVVNFNIYPNPSSAVFNVVLELSHTVPVEISVYSITGQTIAVSPKENPANGSYQIDMGAEAEGVYFVKVKAGDNSLIRRITLVR